MLELKKILTKRLHIDSNLLLILVAAIVMRFSFLHILPAGITNDELEYVNAAKSIYFQGKVLPYTSPTGLFSWGNKEVSATGSLAELPPYLSAIIIGPFANSLFMARLPYALLSVGIVVILYSISKQLFENKKVAFAIGLIASFNPWAVYFGRTSFEFTFAIFFYLLGILLFIKNKGKNYLVALLPFLCGFLSYHGTKILLVPLVILTALYVFWEKRNKAATTFNAVVLPISLTVLVFILYVVTLQFQPTKNRVQELIFSDTDKATQAVQQERRQSIPGFQQNFIYNKPLYFVRRMTATYLGAFSVEKLFINGEGGTHVLTMYQHGMFYLIDAILLVIGLLAGFTFHKKVCFYLLGLLAIAPLPSIIHKGNSTYVIRSSLLFVVFIVFVGLGAYYLYQKIPTKFKKAGVMGIAAIYFVCIIQFVNLYVNRLPVYNGEAFFFSNKAVARYIQVALNGDAASKIVVSSGEPHVAFQQYLFYTNNFNKKTLTTLTEGFRNKKYELGRVEYIRGCPQEPLPDTVVWIHEDPLQCAPQASESAHISSPADAGTQVTIRNEKICTKFDLGRYPVIGSVSDFDLFRLSDAEFCKKWITFL